MTNAEYWGLMKFIEKDSLDQEESREWDQTLQRAYRAFRIQEGRTHQSILDFVEWFTSQPQPADPA